MKIHKEGYQSIGITALLFGIINLFSFNLLSNNYPLIAIIIFAVTLLLFLFIISFFRIPNRLLTDDEEQIICPADGKVVVIEETTETEFLKDKRIQLSVFMSPVNVHINRNPITGVIKYFKYNPGKYLVAWHPKSSTENERTTIVIENSDGVAVLFRQIAGALARRIVWYVKEGDKVEQGQQFGFIKFGSRVDVFLPIGSQIKVELGQVVKGGRTILAELPEKAVPVKPEPAAKAKKLDITEPVETVAAKPVKTAGVKKA